MNRYNKQRCKSTCYNSTCMHMRRGIFILKKSGKINRSVSEGRDYRTIHHASVFLKHMSPDLWQLYHLFFYFKKTYAYNDRLIFLFFCHVVRLQFCKTIPNWIIFKHRLSLRRKINEEITYARTLTIFFLIHILSILFIKLRKVCKKNKRKLFKKILNLNLK